MVLSPDCKLKNSRDPNNQKNSETVAILNLKRKLECSVNLSRLRWGGGGDRGPQVLQHNQNCLKHVYTKQYYPTTPSICTNGRVHTSSLLHANDVSSEKKKQKKSSAFVFMPISRWRRWFLPPGPFAFWILDVSTWTPVLPFVRKSR